MSGAPTREEVRGWSRERCITWLVWNDRNGCYTDEDRAAEGWAPLKRREAQGRVLRELREAREQAGS